MKEKGMKAKVPAVASIAVFLLWQVAAGAGGITFSGSVPIGEGILKAGAVKAFEKKYNIKFGSVETPGTGPGIKAVSDGKVDIAGSARPLKAEEKKQKLLGSTIGYEAVAIYVHKNNPVTNLSREQLKSIFSGRMQNWKDAGGKNAPIAPVTSSSGTRAIVQIFEEKVMNNAAYGSGYKNIDQPGDKIGAIAADENGICADSLGLMSSLSSGIREKVKVITVNGIEPTEKNIRSGAYPITTSLLLVTKGLPKADVKKFIEFMLSRDGQAFVAQSFIPVKR
jgi:phosphate transport system substrate-binding protein